MKKIIFFSAIALLAFVDGELWATNLYSTHNFNAPYSMCAKVYRERYIVDSTKYIVLHAQKKNMSVVAISINTDNIEIKKPLKGEITIALDNLYISQDSYIYLTKFDTVNKVISGRFSCKAIHKYNKNDTIKVTEGRFDMKLITK